MAVVNVDLDLTYYDRNSTAPDPSGSTNPCGQTQGVIPDPLRVHEHTPTTFQFKPKNAPADYTASVTDFRYRPKTWSSQKWWRPVGDTNPVNSLWEAGQEFVWNEQNGNNLKIDDLASNIQNYVYVLAVTLTRIGDSTDKKTFIIDPEIHNEEE